MSAREQTSWAGMSARVFSPRCLSANSTRQISQVPYRDGGQGRVLAKAAAGSR